MAVTNPLAYYEKATITAVKSFALQASGFVNQSFGFDLSWTFHVSKVLKTQLKNPEIF
jgi:hypothetical protein